MVTGTGTGRHLMMVKVDLVGMVDMVDMVDNSNMVDSIDMMNIHKNYGYL